MARKSKTTISRKQALDARPHQLEVVRCSEDDNGELRLVVKTHRTGWQRWFGIPKTYERQYVLDRLGREVYEKCDGEKSVRKIVQKFAKDHKMTEGEAEKSVSLYLKTLMTKGLVGMEIDDSGKDKA